MNIDIDTPAAAPTKEELIREKRKIHQRKYREKTHDQYVKYSRELYHKSKEDPEWYEHKKEISRKNSKLYYHKKKQRLLENPDYVPRGKGRPRIYGLTVENQ